MKKRKAIILWTTLSVLLIAVFAIVILSRPVAVTPENLKTGDIYQLRNLEWGMSLKAVNQIWTKKLQPDPGAAAVPDLPKNETVYISKKGSVFDGVSADILFYFRDDKLYQIAFTFPDTVDGDWLDTQLTALSGLGGTEDFVSESIVGTTYKWSLGNTYMVFLLTKTQKTAQLAIGTN